MYPLYWIERCNDSGRCNSPNIITRQNIPWVNFACSMTYNSPNWTWYILPRQTLTKKIHKVLSIIIPWNNLVHWPSLFFLNMILQPKYTWGNFLLPRTSCQNYPRYILANYYVWLLQRCYSLLNRNRRRFVCMQSSKAAWQAWFTLLENFELLLPVKKINICLNIDSFSICGEICLKFISSGLVWII